MKVLTRAQIDALLREERIGHLGCHAEGRTYVVPIAYAYDGENLYARSGDGLKIRTMRANPTVCFEVTHVDGARRWRSAVAFGAFEELSGAAEDRAARMLFERFGSSPGNGRTIFFRLRLDDVSGRAEGED